MSVKGDLIKYGDAMKGVDAGIEKALQKICAKTVAQAKQLAPVDKGLLKGSLTYSTSKKKGELESKPKKGEAYVGTNVEYAVYQEFGTRHIAPQPFLRPAVAIEVQGQNAKHILKKTINENLKGSLSKTKKRESFLI